MREMMSLRDAMDRLFEESFISPRMMPLWSAGEGTSLAVDVVENDDNFVLKAPVPGVKPEDIEISVVGNVLSIRGESKTEEKVEEVNYLRREMRYGAFQRSLTLPVDVEADKAEASFEDGIITLTLPKAEAVKTKSIKISVK
jgi:HSP20 family protein